MSGPTNVAKSPSTLRAFVVSHTHWDRASHLAFEMNRFHLVRVMDEALATMTGQAHVVHLSNILDWLSHEEAARTLELARQALRPGGRVIIRQLNSSLDIPALGQGFVWETAEADMLHRQDRSFFYRALHLGRRA